MSKITSSVLDKAKLLGCFIANSEEWVRHGEAAWRDMAAKLRSTPECERLLGLDTEWFNKNPLAVVQVATATHCFVLHLSYFSQRRLPDPVREVLEDPSVIKCGVGVTGDVRRLAAEQQLTISTLFDVETFSVQTGLAQPGGTGLKALAEGVAGVTIEKPYAITRSNWELPLNAAQVTYAAEDAIASFLVGQRVLREVVRGSAAEAPAATAAVLKLKAPLAARAYKAAVRALAQQKAEAQRREAKGSGEEDAMGGFTAKQLGGEGRVRVLSRDNQFLFECSYGRAKYYALEKNIAKVIKYQEKNNRKPAVIQLLFDPQFKTRLCIYNILSFCELGTKCPFAHGLEELTPEARGLLDSSAAGTPSCACCLGAKGLFRHAMVPPSLRRFLPRPFRSKKEEHLEDFVPICYQCNILLRHLYEEEMRRVYKDAERRAAELHYPKGGVQLATVGKCVSYARLLRDEEKLNSIPAARQEQLAAFIRKHWRRTYLADMVKDDYVPPTAFSSETALRADADFLDHLGGVVPGDVRAKYTMDLLLRALPNPNPAPPSCADTTLTQGRAGKKEAEARMGEKDEEEQETPPLVLEDDAGETVQQRAREFVERWRSFCFSNCKMLPKESNKMTDEDWKIYRDAQKA